LLFGFGVLLLLLIAVSLFVMLKMNHLAGFTTSLYRHPLTVSNAIRDANIDIIKMHRSMKDVAMASNEEQLNAAVAEVDRLEARVFESLKIVKERYLGDIKQVDELRLRFAGWKQIRDEVIQLTQQKEISRAADITKGKGARYIEKLEAQINNFSDFASGKAAEFLANAQNSEKMTNMIVTIAIILSILISVFIAYLITLSITKPVKLALNMTEKLSRGEIDVRVDNVSTDEMGQMLTGMNGMAERLREQIRELSEGIAVLATSAAQISSTTAEFASTTQQVATSVNEVVVSMKEVKQTTELSSEKAKDMADRSKNVVQISRNGEHAVHQTVEAINSIQEQMMSIADSVVGLSDQSQSIGEIIAAVDDVADQSRLLAVNASIEAVKAGEQGKGFTVVADEIKSLAEQSKQSTSQVRTILTDIQKATGAAVMATEKGSKAVENGVNQANQTGGAIQTLGESVDSTSQSAIQIEATSRQQVAGIDQVFVAMESISNAISQNADGARQLEQSARNLDQLGKKLKTIVEKYNV
jgi:methyl-accepting chemotaxis protein